MASDAIVQIKDSNNKDMFAFYIPTDADINTFNERIIEFCNYTHTGLENEHKLNWDYVSSNLLRFFMESYKKYTTFNQCKIKLIPPDFENDFVIYNYVIKPIKDNYSNKSVSLFESLIIESSPL